MKSIADFKAYYEEAMLPELEELEARRKRFLLRRQILFVVVTLILGAHAILILLKIPPLVPYLPVWSFFISAFFIPTLAFGVFYALMTDNALPDDFRKLLIRETMFFLIEDVETDDDAYIDYETVAKSKIFVQKPEHYTGSGLTVGNLDEIKTVFSNLQMGYHTSTQSAQGKTEWKIVFQGLFFVGNFGDKFKGTTLVIPDKSEQTHGFLGAELKKNNSYRGQNVQFRKHPRFSEYFAVYSDAPNEAREILSDDLINRFLEFTKRMNTNIYLSCTGRKIYVGLHLEGSELAFSFNISVTDFKRIASYYRELTLVFEIIHSLNERLVPEEEEEE